MLIREDMKKRTIIKLLPIVAILSLAGCVSVPHLNEETTLVNKNITLNQENYKLSEVKSYSVESEFWWKNLHDEQLNNLMDKALKYNDDMKIALLNIEKTKINVELAQTAQTPSLNLDGYAQRQKLSENGLTPPPYSGQMINFAQVAVNTSYDFDFFGKYDALIKEQELKLKALALKKDALVLNISNQIVKQYGYWQFLKAQEDNIITQLKIEKENVGLQQKKQDLGIGLKQNVLSEDVLLQNLEIQLTQTKQNLKQTENNIQVLVGNTEIQSLKKTTQLFAYSLPEVESIQSDVVRNRPDVAYYLMMINSQKYHLASLKADFYPSFSLTGDIGLQKVDFAHFFSIKNWFGNIGPSIHLPILDSGRIKGTYQVAGVDVNLFIAQYNQAITKSFYDINTQLYNYKNSKEILNKQQAVLSNQNQNFEFNQKQWMLGNISKLNWNTYQLQQEQNKLQFVNNQFAYFNAQIDLMNSLGGALKE